MNFLHQNLLSILLFLPLAGALALLPLRNRDQHILIRWISLVWGCSGSCCRLSCLFHSPGLRAA